MNFKNLNESFTKKYFNEDTLIKTFSDYVSNHAKEKDNNSTTIEVSKEKYKTQLKGNLANKKNKVNKFFKDHPNAESAIVTEDILREARNKTPLIRTLKDVVNETPIDEVAKRKHINLGGKESLSKHKLKESYQDDYWRIILDLEDCYMDIIAENPDLDKREAVLQAIDDKLIYDDDIWTVYRKLFESDPYQDTGSLLEQFTDNMWDELVNDVIG